MHQQMCFVEYMCTQEGLQACSDCRHTWNLGAHAQICGRMAWNPCDDSDKRNACKLDSLSDPQRQPSKDRCIESSLIQMASQMAAY